MDRTDLPIGIFDSGIGGLTVLDAMARRLPNEDLLYLGDTARVPYGTRSADTVRAYAQRVAGHLVRRGVKALIVACNTATTWALEPLQAAGDAHGIPVIGVIAPGVAKALALTRTGSVAVIGTQGTIDGGRYTAGLVAARPDIRVHELPCPLFVSLAEEGWVDGEIAQLVAERYLAPLRTVGEIDTLILGCTHYPLLSAVIAQTLPQVQLVDSATATADAAAEALARAGRLRPDDGHRGRTSFLVTDNLHRFTEVGTRFLSQSPEPVELINLTDEDARAFAPPASVQGVAL